jgi:hypothetical protein
LAGALLVDEKIPFSAALFWFGLQFVGFLQILFSQAVIHKTIVDFPAFWRPVWRKKIAVCVVAIQPVI